MFTEDRLLASIQARNPENWPQPGDYAQHDEYDGEVVECDGETVTIELYGDDEDGADNWQITVPYRHSDWH